MSSRFVTGLVLVAVAVTAACGGGSNESPQPATLRVSAAASLTEAFTELGERFEAEQSDVRVRFNFASSSSLAQQVNDGGPIDVFASADKSNMDRVVDAGHATRPRLIARNRLAILVEANNPKAIASLADLVRPGIVLVLCAPEVPCGQLAAAAFRTANVTPKPASLEENVKGVVAKVVLGEADAGIVYVTDVKAAGDAASGVTIDIATDPNLEAKYFAATTSQAAQPNAARAWIDYLGSPTGKQVLATYGFLAP